MNAGSCEGQRTTWDHLLLDKQSCMTAHRVWWSPKASKVPATLVTQLSYNRLPQLKAQCLAWGGPLAASVYLAILSPLSESSSGGLSIEARQLLQDATTAIDQLYLSTEEGGHCQLRIAFVYEVFETEKASSLLYPVNTLRNIARLMADTPLIANIDVDMLPSAELGNSLAEKPEPYVSGCTKDKHVYVLPAFETR